ncbi:MAG: heavy-metal-associated domain-containing protein [Bacteroidetes bacterium]|nr:heavy-metal-associated domain-containing protein [Bacteroidota bacterium]
MIKLNLIAFSIAVVFLFAGCGKNETKTAENKPVETKTEQVKTESTSNAQTSDKNVQTVEFKCKGMTCSSCENKISSEVKKLKGIKEVIADSKTKTAKIVYAAGEVSAKDIENVINKAGYDTETSKSDNPHDCSKENSEECKDKKDGNSDCCKDKKTKKKSNL